MDDFIYKDEGFKIIGCFYAVYNTLGPGFLESVYQEALEKEFIKNNILYKKEQKVEVYYDDDKLKKYFKADFICYEKIIVEVKAQKFITAWYVRFLAHSSWGYCSSIILKPFYLLKKKIKNRNKPQQDWCY